MTEYNRIPCRHEKNTSQPLALILTKRIRFYYDWSYGKYGGILLPPTCKINYVITQNDFVNIQLIYENFQQNYMYFHLQKYVNMQDYYVDMRLKSC